MARKRISEFRAKTLISQALEQPYNGISVTADNPLTQIDQTHHEKQYVVKVDQGVKGRFKKGLVLLDQTISQVPDAVNQLRGKGYSRFLVEPMTEHDSADERYLAMEQTRDGIVLSYSQFGGIDIESNPNEVKQTLLSSRHSGERWNLFGSEAQARRDDIKKKTGLDYKILEKLINVFNNNYISFLEINPFIIHNTEFILLDAAVEVDSTAEFFVNDAWSEADFTDAATKQKTSEEINVRQLAAKSQAAFSLEVLNPDASIFMMLSGGGASIVLADEVYNQGFGKQLANYGEYSGNPNAEETYIYARNVLSLLLKSNAPKKVLIIAGGVANFTDVRITFSGLIKALDEMKKELQEQNIKVYVRRGGPYQEEGLQQMHDFLQKNNLLGVVSGPDMVLTDIAAKALAELKL